MMNIRIAGFDQDTTEDEIREALENFGVGVGEITMEPSDNPQRRFALIGVDTDETGCQVIVDKVNGKAWKGRRLEAEYLKFFKS